MAGVDNNSWGQYQKLVTKEKTMKSQEVKLVMEKLEKHDGKFSNIDSKLTQIQVDIATLKVKAGVWGGIAGLVPVVLGLVLFYASKV